ncbi:MAG: putative bifunctional diguanylate cyclase/phosphodiesterase [Sulfuricella sp.]
MKRSPLSMRAKLALGSLAAQIVVLALLLAGSMQVMEKHLLEMAHMRLREVEPLLNASLAAALAQRDFATLEDVLEAVRREQGISYLVLLDNQDKEVASAGWPKGEALPPLDTDLAIEDADSPGRFDTQIPVTLAGQTYGRLRFGLSTQFLADGRADLALRGGIVAAAAVALALAMLAALSYWLTRPLIQLTRAAQEVSGGNFEISLPVSSRDEVGILTATFNGMAAAVRSRVADLKEAEKLQRSYLAQAENEHARLAALLSAMNLGILFVGTDNRVIYYNPAFLRIWMIPEDKELIGKPTTEILSLSTNVLARPDHFSRHLLEVTQTHEISDSFEIQMADRRVVTQITYPVHDKEVRLIGRLWIYEDITRERQTAEQLIYLAERDFLTGLYNRHRFQEELGKMTADSDRRGSTGALLFFDLDEFKYVNDTYGHSTGDAMLIRVAGEVSALTRCNEIFSRLGGDEFAILLPETSEHEACALAERVVRAVAQIPFRFEGQNLRLTSSMGVALYPEHAENAEDLVTHADIAMYQAKDAGKNTWRVYRPDLDMSKAMVTRLSWNERIGDALENALLRLHFQGVYRAQDGGLSHLEALVRMMDTENPGQIIMPGHFITFAEKSGKIQEIDRWVIRASIELLASSPDIPPIAVNISGRSFDDPTLPRHIAGQLAHYRVKPCRLLVELTETAAVSDLHDAQRFIEALRQTGCTVCLDDFGTGFSSFAYLKHLDVDILKIDGLFIRNLPNDHDNQLFVKAIVDVASGMRKTTVAEFVEDRETLEMLKRFGVDLVQGYHLDRPRADHPAIINPDISYSVQAINSHPR